MTRHRFDRAIAELAQKQHGSFSHRQAVLLGGSDTMIRTRLRTGAWVRLVRAVYALASHPPTWKRQYKAAELSKPGSAICGRPAGLVHGLEGSKVLRPELVVPVGSSVRSSIARVHTGKDVLTEVVDGISVTTVAQTLLDMLVSCPVDVVERAMDGALLAGRLRLADSEERIVSLSGSRWPSLGEYEALVRERRIDGWAPPESELERRLADLVRRLPSGISAVRQAGLPWWEPGAGRVDLLIPAWRLILEADGRRWHARVADFDHDRWRDNVALAHGHRVLRFTHTHISQRPIEVLDIILATGQWRTVAA